MKTLLPSVFPGVSGFGTSVPISLKSFGSLSVTLVGGFSFDALATSSPNLAERPERACDTTPFFTVIAFLETPHCLAAASTNIARAVAPASRIGRYELGVALEPPVPCSPIALLA